MGGRERWCPRPLGLMSAVSIRPEPGDKGDERQGSQGQEHGTYARDDDADAQENEYDGQQKRRQIPEVFHGVISLAR